MDKNIFKVSRKATIKINNDGLRQFVPEKADKYQENNKTLEKIAICLQNGLPVLLSGETGTGKTSAVKYLAKQTQNNFFRVNHNGATTVEDIVGKFLVNEKGTYWIDGVLTQAVRKGGYYLADELNACTADILFVYHSILEKNGKLVIAENGNEIIEPHPDFHFFATLNPSGDYVGVKEINKALLSRFAVVKVDFPEPKIEIGIISGRTGISSEDAKKMVACASELRASYAKEDIQFIVSTRDLIQWATLFKVYKKFLPSAELSILNKVPADNYNAVKDNLILHFKGLDNPQIKKDEQPTKADLALEAKETPAV